MISITELAEITGVSIRTIRYYEELGIIGKATRVNGRRYFSKDESIKKMNEILFLKSLHFKLSDIELVMKDPLYIKPLLLNIGLGLVRLEMENLAKEVSKLEQELCMYDWREIEIKDESILTKMINQYFKLADLEKKVKNKNYISIDESKGFIKFYKNWHRRLGFKITDEHLRLIAFNPKIILEPKVKKLFQNYFK